MEVLEEAPGEAGATLWMLLRNVRVWTRTGEGERGAPCQPGMAERLSELSAGDASLADAARTLTRAAPSAVEVATACQAIADRATTLRWSATALAFEQAASLALPDDAALAYRVGRRARQNGEAPRAETWFLHAAYVARRTRDAGVLGISLLGVANLFRERGNLRGARRLMERALRTARRHRDTRVEAMSLHDLFVMAAETGQVEEAVTLATAAAEAYGAGHERLPLLAHDLGILWTLHGEFARSLEILEPLRPFIHTFPERLYLLSGIARAAAALGKSTLYRSARRETLELLPRSEAVEGVAVVLLNLAYAAVSLGHWSRARSEADRAVAVATRMREGRVLLEAEAVRGSAENRGAGPVPREGKEQAPEAAGRAVETFRRLLAPA